MRATDFPGREKDPESRLRGPAGGYAPRAERAGRAAHARAEAGRAELRQAGWRALGSGRSGGGPTMSAHQRGTELGKGPRSLSPLSVAPGPLSLRASRCPVPWPGVPGRVLPGAGGVGLGAAPGRHSPCARGPRKPWLTSLIFISGRNRNGLDFYLPTH